MQTNTGAAVSQIPTTMRAALYGEASSITLTEVPVPKVDADTVLVKVETAGICGSDLHNYSGRPLRGRFNEWKGLNHADGHELCGTIVALGNAVTGLTVGQRVVAEAVWHCGKCEFCLTGNYHICKKRTDLAWLGQGAFAEYASLPGRSLYAIPEDMDPFQAATVEPLAATLHSVHKADLRLGDTTFTVGGGTLGQLSIALSRLCGVSRSGIAVRYPQQARVAREFQADVVFARSDSVPSPLDLGYGLGADVVFETTGTAEGFADALAMARKGGKIILLGGNAMPQSVHLGQVVGKELTLRGSLCYGWHGIRREFDEAIALIANERIDVEKIISHRLPFSELPTAFELAANKTSGAIKVQVYADHKD